MRLVYALGLILLSALPLLIGCSGSNPSQATLSLDAAHEPSPVQVRETLRRLATARPDSFLVTRVRQGGLTPTFGTRFRLASGAVAAFIPGRHPVRGQELVMVVARGEGVPGAALIATARILAARAGRSLSPERTVLVVFLPPPAQGDALTALFAAPPWTRDHVAAMLLIEPDEVMAGRAEARAAEQGWALQFIEETSEPQGDVSAVLALARATVHAALLVADTGQQTADFPRPDASVPSQ
ncbi:MAG: hypothetical protein HKN04_11740 [Rhodothermaceae bacterium]|nr:hypothetical protein [Rhodothermaceae bacterium]